MEPVCLIIKAPNQKYDDIKIDCQLSWTILELKVYLSEQYPSKPKINDQRLIYSGHLLKDEQSLSDIIQLSGDSNVFTFHLVCPQRQAPNDSSTKSSTTTTTNPEPSQNESPSSSTNLNNMPTFNQNDWSNLFMNNNQMLGTNNIALQESYNALLQQYHQYMSYYYLTSPAVGYSSYAAFADAYSRSLNANLLVNQNTNLAAAAPTNAARPNDIIPNVNQNRPNNVVENNNLPNNVQVENEDNGNRNWTEFLYSFSKAIVVLSVMYFYSSFGRLLLLIGIGFILYLYKTARLNGDQWNNNNNNNINNVAEDVAPEQNIQDNPPNNEANNNLNNHNQPENNVPDEINNSANQSPNNDNNNESGQNMRYSGIRLVWVFVSSLFTSLIPDPVPIN